MEPLTTQMLHDATASLVNQRCTVVDRAYGDELILGFGQRYPAKPPLSNRFDAPWMLSIRAAEWILEAPEGVIATHATKLTDRKIGAISKRLLDAAVVTIAISDEPSSGIELTLEGPVRLVAKPFAANGRQDRDAAWELRTPDGMVIRPGPASLERLHESEPFSAVETLAESAKETSPDYLPSSDP